MLAILDNLNVFFCFLLNKRFQQDFTVDDTDPKIAKTLFQVENEGNERERLWQGIAH